MAISAISSDTVAVTADSDYSLNDRINSGGDNR